MFSPDDYLFYKLTSNSATFVCGFKINVNIPFDQEKEEPKPDLLHQLLCDFLEEKTPTPCKKSLHSKTKKKSYLDENKP